MKKRIIVTCLIMLVSCGTMRRSAAPTAESQDQLMLATSG